MTHSTPVRRALALLSIGCLATVHAHDKRCSAPPYGDSPESVATYQADPDKPIFILQAACEAKFSRVSRGQFYAAGITDIQIEEHYPTEIAGWYFEALRSKLRDSASPISIVDFALDGKQLARSGSSIRLAGMYVKQNGVEFIYTDTQAVLQSSYSTDAAPPSVPLLTEDASREFRKQLLACRAHPTYAQVGCPVTLWGSATLCTQTNAFGTPREIPCLHVVDGE